MPPAKRRTTTKSSTAASSIIQPAQAVLELDSTGMSRIVVVADTHSEPHPNTHRLIREAGPCAIFHGGDIGALSVLDGLSEVAPVFAVRGNIDERAPHLPDWLTVSLSRGGETVLKILLTHIAVAGPRIRADAAAVARQEGASLIVCGHSHVPFLSSDRGLAVFNPGSVGPRRFMLPIVFGHIDIGLDSVKLSHINAENGLAWSPP